MSAVLAAPPDPATHARAAGLRHVSDAEPGIRRIRRGRGFEYRGPDGARIADPDELLRIRSLAIPPAWSDVWICPREDGHLQATGRDARGRKQYRYHPRWREVRDEAKFHRTLAFGEALPRIRARVARDLARPGLPREKVLATVVRLLELTLVRVGNEEYARANRSYGLTTLRARHVDAKGSRVRFRFRGKGGAEHALELDDPALARVVRRLQELPGQELFQYLDDDGEPRRVASDDVNAYLREAAGEDFTAKDFRTWAGTVLAAVALAASADASSRAARKRAVAKAIARVATELRNTPAVCRRAYVHPAVVERYLEGTLAEDVRERLAGCVDLEREELLAEAERCVLDVLREEATERR